MRINMDDDNSNIDLGASIEEYYRDLEEDAIRDSANIITDTEYKVMMKKEKEKKKEDEKNKKEIPVIDEKKEEKKEYYAAKGGKKEKKEKENFEDEGDRNQNNPYMYWKIIKKDNKFVCFRGEEILYWYDPRTGKYNLNGESLIRELGQKMSNKEYRGLRKSHAAELVDLVKRDNITPKLSEDELKYILLVGNGIITTKDKDGKMIFTPGFNPNYFIMSGIPWNYNPNTRCPKITRFLIELVVDIEKCDSFIDTNELWKNITQEERNKVLTLVEFIGYCLLRSCDLKKFLILKGGQDSGKSKYTDLAEKFLGHESCSGISLQEMRQEYNIAEIYGKMANVRGELSGKNLEDTSIIKIFVNGDPITGRIIRSRPIRFRPYAKLIYATNILPATSSTEDESFYGKIILINCPNKFKRDDTFFDRITPKEEMEGLLIWAIESLKRILENKRFSYEPSWENVAKRFPRYSSQGRNYSTNED